MFSPENAKAAFRKIFKKSRPFGGKVIIIGLDPTNKNMRNNIMKYLEYNNEVPLLAFNYRDEIKEGFVITNYRIAWFYGEVDGEQSCDLEDIGKVEVGRSILARVMKITDVTGKKYSNIYLTGINGEEDFVKAFGDFVKLAQSGGEDEGNPANWPTYDEEDYEPAPPQRERSSSAYSGGGYAAQSNVRQEPPRQVDIQAALRDMRQRYAAYNFKSHVYYCADGGEKITRKLNGAIGSYAQLRSNEVPLLLYDATVMGGGEDGLLVTNYGIYIHNLYDNAIFIEHRNFREAVLKGVFAKDLYVNDVEVKTSGMDNDQKAALRDIIEFIATNC